MAEINEALKAAKLKQNNDRKKYLEKHVLTYFEEGTVIKDVFEIEKLIGGGGFGQIFRAVDLRTKVPLAIKVEVDDHDSGRLILEQAILTKLRGQAHIPLIQASGQHMGFNYIAMQILGRNIGEIRKRQLYRRLSVGSAVRIGQQCVVALKTLHDAGFIHRDVKPSNLCTGSESQCRTIFLIDFGMARMYRHENGLVRKERYRIGFRGTLRYASVKAHEHREQGPVDDFWSLLYSVIELIEGILPWSAMMENRKVAKAKQNVIFEEFGRRVPKQLEDFSTYLCQLSYDQVPDYALLLAILKECQPTNVIDETPFDWEGPFRKTLDESDC